VTRQVGIVLERDEELPAAIEWRDVYEAFRATFGDQDSYALFHRLRMAFDAPRSSDVAHADMLRELLHEPLTPERRVKSLVEGLIGAFRDRRAALEESFTGEQVRDLLGLNSRQALQARREAGQLLAVKENDQLRFPVWQFDSTTETGVLRGLPETLAALQERDPMWTLLWMRTPQRALDNLTPSAALRAGRTQQTVEVAQAAVAD
jgi:hypothetical protein